MLIKGHLVDIFKGCSEVQEEIMLEDFARVDFYVPKYKLIIEVNGYYHYNYMAKLNKQSEAK